jgi:hypothetical protein
VSQVVANLFPLKEVREIVETNRIALAQPYESSREMQLLMAVWKVYVEPDIRITCNACYARVLDNFKALQGYFVERVKQDNILNES